MNKNWLYIGLVLLTGLLGWSIYQYQVEKAALPDRIDLIQEQLEIRQEKYAKKIREKCAKDILKEAQVLADSIVFIKADSLMFFDSVSRPPKPERPIIPEKKPLKDSQAVAPLILTDTLE